MGGGLALEPGPRGMVVVVFQYCLEHVLLHSVPLLAWVGAHYDPFVTGHRVRRGAVEQVSASF